MLIGWTRGATVELLPGGRRVLIYDHRPVDQLVVFNAPIAAATEAAIADLQFDDDVLDAEAYRNAKLGDFMFAGNATSYLTCLRQYFSVEELDEFADEYGLTIMAWIRAALEEDPRRVSWIAERAQLFVQIIGLADAELVCSELAAHHDVEHLIGLQHVLNCALQPRNNRENAG